MAGDVTQLRELLREALDDSVLTHTGRSIGDLASQAVIDDMWPFISRALEIVAQVAAGNAAIYGEHGQLVLAWPNDYLLAGRLVEQARRVMEHRAERSAGDGE